MVLGDLFLLPAHAVLDSSPAWEGLMTLVVVFPALLHQVEQGWFSLEADVKKGDLSL